MELKNKTAKKYHGKALYMPSGAAKQYSYWACNFFCGCTGLCSYCYNRHGITAKVLGADISTLKKCFTSEEHALEVFKKEVLKNIDSLREHGLFFSFVSDPMLKENINLNVLAMYFCTMERVPVKILTKQTWWVAWEVRQALLPKVLHRGSVSIGFTLTGHDEMEVGCASNQQRIEAMKYLFKDDFVTFASIEPVIDFASSLEMIRQTSEFCCHYKIGLQSGKKYNKVELLEFIKNVNSITETHGTPIYWKDELVKLSGMDRSELSRNSVDRNFKLHDLLTY